MEMLIKYNKCSYTLHTDQRTNLKITKEGGREGVCPCARTKHCNSHFNTHHRKATGITRFI